MLAHICNLYQPSVPFATFRRITSAGAASQAATARHTRTCASKGQAEPATAPAEPVAWDPEGLFSGTAPSGGHFERRQRERAARLQQTAPQDPQTHSLRTLSPQHSATEAWERPILRLPDDAASQDGISVGQLSGSDRSRLEKALSKTYMPLNLDQPGLRVHCLDPPVFTVDDFITPELCQELIQQSQATGRMEASKVGADNVQGAAAAENERRTSSTLLLAPQLLAAHPQLTATIDSLHARARKLLPTGSWTAAGKLPKPGGFCFESLQVAHYEQGQHFLEHEDAFPMGFVRENKFQRQATLLVYLNDVASGGLTRFEHLDLAIEPKAGRALLFYPSFAIGTPDARTLHTAEPAAATKWIAQVWIAKGHGVAAPPAAPRSIEPELAFEKLLAAKKKGKRKQTKK